MLESDVESSKGRKPGDAGAKKRMFSTSTKYVSFETHLHPPSLAQQSPETENTVEQEFTDWGDDDLDLQYQVENMRKLAARSMDRGLLGSRDRVFSGSMEPILSESTECVSIPIQRSNDCFMNPSFYDPVKSYQDLYRSTVSLESTDDQIRKSYDDVRRIEIHQIGEYHEGDKNRNLSQDTMEIDVDDYIFPGNNKDQDEEDDEFEDENREEDDIVEEDDNVEDAIFQQELREFSKHMNLNLKRDSKSDLDFLTSFYSLVKLIQILGTDEEDSYNLKLSKVFKKLKDHSKDKRDGTWTLSIKEKKLGAELVLECINTLMKRNSRDALNLAEEAKKRAEKEFQGIGDNWKDRLVSLRLLIFADTFILSFDKERNVLLPPHLLSEEQKQQVSAEMEKNIFRLQSIVSRKKGDSQKGRRTKTREVFLESPLDQLLRSVYPLMSECRGFSSPSRFIQKYSSTKMALDVRFVPEREECCVGVPLGKYLIRNAWTQDNNDDKVVDFQSVYAFMWKQNHILCFRTKRTLFEKSLKSLQTTVLNLEIVLDEEYDIHQFRCIDEDNTEITGRSQEPSFVRRNLMEEAQGGLMDVETYSDISKCGLFYLDSVFGLKLDSTDEENRTLLHYAAWIGKQDVLEILLKLHPSLAFAQDEYGETPLMLAVKGGKDCFSSLKLLLADVSPAKINMRNMFGQTGLHLSTIGVEFSVTEALIKAGASVAIKDKNGRLPVDLIDSTNSNRKTLISLLRKFSR